MKLSTLAGVAAAALLAALPAPIAVAQSAGAPTPPTIEQLAAYPTFSNFTVSPDGRQIAAIQSRGEERAVVVWDAADLSKPPRVLGSRHMKLQGVSFIKNDILAVSAYQLFDWGSTKTFLGKLYLTNVSRGGWNDPLTSVPTRSRSEEEQLQRSSARVLSTLPGDPDHFLMMVAGDVYKYNVRTNRSERILRSGDRVNDYDVDLQGVPRARSVTGRDGQGFYVATEFGDGAGNWTEHVRNYVKDREVFSVAGFSADPNIAFVISNRGRDKAAIYEYNIATRQLGEIAFSHPLFEATGVSVWSIPGENFGEVASFSYAGLRNESFAVMPELEAIRTAVEGTLGIRPTPVAIVDPESGEERTIPYNVGRYARIVTASDDLNTVIIWAGGPNDPGAYYLLKNRTNLSVLARPHEEINPASLGASTDVTVEARDGLRFPAFLTRPSEALYGPGPHPLVVLPHGGPWSRDDLEWDGSMWPQLLASRGYAVIQPQFRGSSGWGKRLWMAGDREWGQKMQDDLDDSVRWAIQNGVAQPERVAMFGFSYGGYAAMAAAVRPNGLYKCAISGAGVSDLSRISRELLSNPYAREAQRETIAGLSPAQAAGSISIPIMLYHGERDQTARIEHSEWFVNAARASGQDVQFNRLDDYGHGNAWTREIMAQQLRLIDDYFREGCAGGL